MLLYGAGSQVVLNPESRLIPVGVEALFACKFRNVTRPYWEINGIKANHDFNKMLLRAGSRLHYRVGTDIQRWNCGPHNESKWIISTTTQFTHSVQDI